MHRVHASFMAIAAGMCCLMNWRRGFTMCFLAHEPGSRHLTTIVINVCNAVSIARVRPYQASIANVADMRFEPIQWVAPEGPARERVTVGA
jgi:hypothetical protein